jgi:hypothetical protein
MIHFFYVHTDDFHQVIFYGEVALVFERMEGPTLDLFVAGQGMEGSLSTDGW